MNLVHTNNHSTENNKPVSEIVAFCYDKGYSVYRLDEDGVEDFWDAYERITKEVHVYMFWNYEDLEQFLCED